MGPWICFTTMLRCSKSDLTLKCAVPHLKSFERADFSGFKRRVPVKNLCQDFALQTTDLHPSPSSLWLPCNTLPVHSRGPSMQFLSHTSLLIIRHVSRWKWQTTCGFAKHTRATLDGTSCFSYDCQQCQTRVDWVLKFDKAGGVGEEGWRILGTHLIGEKYIPDWICTIYVCNML